MHFCRVLLLAQASAVTVSCSGTELTGPPPVTAVEVIPGVRRISATGDTVRLVAYAKDASGNTIPDKTPSWSSSDPLVATVDVHSGLVTAVANGEATIMAVIDRVEGAAAITVAQAVVEVLVSPGNHSLGALQDTVWFTAEALDAKGNHISGSEFDWTSSAPAVATVDSTGLATAQACGKATIIAATHGVQGAAELTVAQAVGGLTVTLRPSATSEALS